MEAIDIVIETPRGSSQKYNYDEESRFFKLKKILPAGMVFPFDFGFIPGTKGEDGDPLDILIISEFQSFPGCLISCRVIGGIKAEQVEKNTTEKLRNDRFLAVPIQSESYREIQNASDLPRKIVDDIKQFFVNYNEIAGKQFIPRGVMNAKAATKLIDRGKG